ncbi:hypothetical protein SH661x_001385 [Planctomicrobium sp. SH661]|uniref:hypothetical protein n=1 Tax=Planctomicrobium sp. SH661 TaxID=3448124 RepID=UPI003F5C48C2
MCADSIPEDLTRSRFRWYDFPAVLFYHRPVRCRFCDQRYFTLRKRKSIGMLPRLWMHYAILISICCVTVSLFKYQGNQARATASVTGKPDQLSNAKAEQPN